MSRYLEIDPKILENNLLLCDSSSNVDSFEKFVQSNDVFASGNVPWKCVTPVPGCCLKTTDEKQNKVFINICQINDIPQPASISEDELLEIWQSDEASDYRIPLSIQDPHDELDKSGKPAVVYDVALNSEFLKKIQKSPIFLSFVVQVILEGVENKYNITLKKEGYVILQNRRSIGELRSHRIRVNKGPYVPPKRLIEEVGPSENIKSLPKKEKSVKGKVEYRIFENTNSKLLIGQFHLPKIISVNDISLDVGENRIVLGSKNNLYSTDLFFAVKIDETRVKARFNSYSKILNVIMPIISV